MIKIHHLNCANLVSTYGDYMGGHCLLLEQEDTLVLVDTGIGLLDTLQPLERIGRSLREQAGPCLVEELTAIRQIERMGFDPGQVKHCIISHADFDHIGGLADFPDALVHISDEEYRNFVSGSPRFLPVQLAHRPKVIPYGPGKDRWFGLEARRILLDIGLELYFIPLFGHTLGHCGIALKQGKEHWLLYVGDAYFLRAELSNPDHPIGQMLAQSAQDNEQRIRSLNKIRKLATRHNHIDLFCYHDFEEFLRYAERGKGVERLA